jgi:Tol biopolymer transport system component
LISGAVGPGDHEHETSSIWLVSILGGAPRRLRGDAFNAKLSPDDSTIVYESGDDIWLADADGENPRELIAAGDWENLVDMEWSSDGKRIVYKKVTRGKYGPVETIESRPLDGTDSIVLVEQKKRTGGFLVLEDRLVYGMTEPEGPDENLWELALDPRSGKPRGEPRRLTDRVGFRFDGMSITADGSTIAFLNERGQGDVYVGRLTDAGRGFEDEPRRLTLDNRNDGPLTWTPDSSAVVFRSARNGNLDLFVQALDQRNAQELALGKDHQGGARRTPDGESYLYWEWPERGSASDRSGRLLRIPVDGGPTEIVYEGEYGGDVQCASAVDGGCFMIQFRFEERARVVSRLDPVEGPGEELWRFDMDPKLFMRLALSPDGRRMAVVGHTEDARSIRLQDAVTGEMLREIELDGLPGMELSQAAWAADGGGLYLVGDTPRGVALVHMDLGGEATVMWEVRSGWLFELKPSPDGGWLAFGKRTPEANVWMVEGF